MEERQNVISLMLREMQYRNYSKRTLESYTKFMLALEKALVPVPLSAITTEQFKNYLYLRVQHDKVSVSFINQTISAWKILQTDVLKREYESIKIKRPRREKKYPTVLTQQEVEKILNVTQNIKHKALLMLTYSAGLRRDELRLMKPSAIDSKNMRVHVVQGKGKKDRYTILSPKVLEYLRIYFVSEKPKVYLFETRMKTGSPLSSGSLNKIIKNGAKKAGIKKNVSFHTLRHCFATHLLEQGVNLRLIQDFMGHTSLKTTSIYLHLANIKTSGVISPLENMNI